MYAVQCDFRSSDLQHVWAHVCHRGEPYAAVMSCRTCGYLVPDTSVYIGPGHQKNREGAFVWTCMYCLDDGGLCREACVLSYRTKWRQRSDEHLSWVARYPSRSGWYNSEEEIMHCRTYNWAAFQRSIAALYERRRVAQQYGCFAEVGLYYLPVREEAT